MKKIIIPVIIAVALLAGCSASGGSSAPAPTASALAHQLQAKGLQVSRLITYTAATDPNHLLGRQGGYSSKVEWSTGGIEVYPDPAGAQSRLAYLKSFTPPLGDGYDFINGDAVLRLDATLTPAQAAQYHQAFDTSGS